MKYIPVLGLLFLTSCKYFVNEERPSFKEVYGDGVFNESNAIIPLADGSYVIAGYSIAQNDPNLQDMPYDLLMLKIDAGGHIDWQQVFSFSDFDEATGVVADKDGNLILTGQVRNGNGDMDVLLAKLNSDGDTIWTRGIGTEQDEKANAIQPTADGGYILAGASGLFAIFNPDLPKDMFIVKADGLGKVQWSRQYGYLGQDEANDIKVLKDGSFIVAGNTTDTLSGKSSMYLLKLNQAGDTVWTHTLQTDAATFCRSVELSPDGGFIAGGLSRDSSGAQDILVIKLDGNGQLVWTKSFGGAEQEEFGGMTAVPGEGYIIAGSTFGATKGNRVYLVKINEAGESLFTKTFDGPNNETARSIILTKNKGYLITGVQEGENRSLVFALKVNEKGELVQ